MRRPSFSFVAGIVSAAALQGAALAAPASQSQLSGLNSAANIQQFGLSAKAQARCEPAIRKAANSVDHNRPVNFSAWEKSCPAFATQIQSIAAFPPALQKGALLLLFHGDIGSQGMFFEVC